MTRRQASGLAPCHSFGFAGGCGGEGLGIKKASLFNSVFYQGPTPSGGWPVPVDAYSSEIAEISLAHAIEQFGLADQLGFDWVTVAQHHFGPYSLTFNPMVIAGALSQVVKNVKIALMGAQRICHLQRQSRGIAGRFEEALRLIRMAWTEDQPFGWQGRYFETRSISIWPRPVQQPHPPICNRPVSPRCGRWR